MDLLNQVRAAGVIGAGGAGFPTHVKLDASADYILLNGAECEPLLRVDQQLMALYPDDIIQGLAAAGRQVQAGKAIIGIKGKHEDVIRILKDHIRLLHLEDYVKVGILPDIYPAGDEQVLVYELTGRVVPECAIPLAVGCVVINAETALNVAHAAVGKSVTETYITLNGDIPRPITVKVPVGVPVKDVLLLSGIKNLDEYGVINGGPMMGSVMDAYDGYVTKKNKGFIILKKEHYLIRKKMMTFDQARIVGRTSCEQCRMCTDMCPRYLLGHNMQPHKMMRVIKYTPNDAESMKIAQLCSQCNLCEMFSCQAQLSPRAVNVWCKGKLREKGVKYTPFKETYTPRESRSYRLVPSKRLIARLGLTPFDGAAPLTEIHFDPQEIGISLQQHVGAPAQPVVKVGDVVTEGQLIGEIKEGSLGAAVHASMNGTVANITEQIIKIKVGAYV
ncbi:NADH dehydrogenase [Megasphaera cerevisiae DSM 20462]|uniref:NADH dehydrogenase n=1 Tax=Megasphaera cerevisiae DSM 20462 TaxID=1122219 RepID=A0A0J6WTM0_9FIRM|nr:4Fe-4S dicluster domain-containing protein [Megasphaera cerevisiae]KMO86895.1 NADH dehydrogenase [Megasphaera cerevisiae DSM 20462]SJZ80549.1 Na+-translocating ferredoxin:NAD+ oxidoreductase RNF, RnfC subunit [Megasphaera cerevisiae DSM 20462]